VPALNNKATGGGYPPMFYFVKQSMGDYIAVVMPVETGIQIVN
jgi:hypothetical protein